MSYSKDKSVFKLPIDNYTEIRLMKNGSLIDGKYINQFKILITRNSRKMTGVKIQIKKG